MSLLKMYSVVFDARITAPDIFVKIQTCIKTFKKKPKMGISNKNSKSIFCTITTTFSTGLSE